MSEADENKPSSSPAKAIAIGIVVLLVARLDALTGWRGAQS